MKGETMNPNNSFKRGLNRLKEEWERQPLTVLFIAGIAATGAAKLIDASSAAQGRRAYAKQVEYRTRNKL
jgi:hypothetical protein